MIKTETSLETYFGKFRENILGVDESFNTPHGTKKLLYADWTASGRMYRPIEDRMIELGAFVANTHTETSFTGKLMTTAYHEARHIIKHHVNAADTDALIVTGTGMTGAIVKMQRMLGLKYPERLKKYISYPENERPVVFITHMEHHSNQTSWLETLAEVVVVKEDVDGLISLENWENTVAKYADRKWKIASVTAASNVTGIQTPYHEIAKIIHKHNGWCFVDFACSGPYVKINMHPEDPAASLDAIFMSPHKFLGGPGTPGVMIFSRELYHNRIPDTPGGGTVAWTNPWGGHSYFEDIEVREDGGTPGFLQTIRAALSIRLKEEMGVENIIEREHEIIDYIFSRLNKIENVHILAGQHQNRLGVVSFYIDDMAYNLGVRMLNDRFGMQVRGGCSCAGTYGHYLLNVDEELSHSMTDKIDQGDYSSKLGWIRMSIHPTMTNEEVKSLCDAVEAVAMNWQDWAVEYAPIPKSNDFEHKFFKGEENRMVDRWFEL